MPPLNAADYRATSKRHTVQPTMSSLVSVPVIGLFRTKSMRLCRFSMAFTWGVGWVWGGQAQGLGLRVGSWV